MRIPAALCGIFGLKTTAGLWPTDGVLPYSATFDSIGLLTRSAADASTAFAALQGTPPVQAGRVGQDRRAGRDVVDCYAAGEIGVGEEEGEGRATKDAAMTTRQQQEIADFPRQPVDVCTKHKAQHPRHTGSAGGCAGGNAGAHS